MKRIIILLLISLVLISSGFATQYKRNPDLDNFNVSIDGGLKLCYRNRCLLYEPVFVMENGQLYRWGDIPPTIEKNLWKTKVQDNKYKYGADFSNVPASVKNNLKFLVLHRLNATRIDDYGNEWGMNVSELFKYIKRDGNTIYLNDAVELSHDDLLQTYSIPKINLSHIVIGNIDNEWPVCDEYFENLTTGFANCTAYRMEGNWKLNGDGTYNISFDPTITLNIENVVTDSYLVNISYRNLRQNYTYLNLSNSSPYDALVAYFSFDGDRHHDTQGSVEDLTGNVPPGEHQGTHVNLSGCMPGLGRCLDRANIDASVLRFAASDELEDFTEFTIMAWVLIHRVGNNWGRIVSKSNGATGDDYGLLIDDNARDAVFRLTTSTTTSLNSPSGLSTDDWNHIVGRWDGNRMVLYVDGLQVASALKSGTIQNSNTWLSMMRHSNSIDERYLDGMIDEVMIFNKNLTDAEILAIYQNQSARFVNEGEQRIRGFKVTNTTTWDNGGDNRVNLTMQSKPDSGSSIPARMGQLNLSVNNFQLMAYYPFEWGKALDITGNGNDGTRNGDVVVNRTSGLNGTFGLQFDGSGDYINVLDADLSNGFPGKSGTGSTGNMTVGGWFNFASITTGTDQDMIDKYSSAAGSDSFRLLWSDDDNFYFMLSDDGTSLTYDTHSYTPTLNEWVFVVGTYNGSHIDIFVDGVSDGATAYSGGVFLTATDFSLGARTNNPARYFQGMMDNIFVFNRTLSLSEITNLYTQQSAAYHKPYYSEYINHTINVTTHTINPEADFVFADLLFRSGDYNFYSPYIGDDVTLTTFTGEDVADVTPPVITALTNLSTTNVSSIISWNCDENCNYTLRLYNDSLRQSLNLVQSLFNNSFETTHTPYFESLINSTYYFINLTVWDSSGNSAKNNTFNFSTAKTELVADSCTYGGSGDYTPLCSDNCNEGTIDIQGNNVLITGDGTFKGNLTNYQNLTIQAPASCIAWTSF